MSELTTKDALLERMVTATEELVTNIPTKFDKYLPLAGGIMTGNLRGNRSDNGFVITNLNADYGLLLYGYNSSENSGATISLYSKDRSNNKGYFLVRASDGTNKPALIGKPDGTLTWDGQPIQTSSDKRLKTEFADVPAEVLKAWGNVKWQQYKFKADAETKEHARYHVGIVAQDVEATCKGILDYGILCHDTETDMWTVRYEEALCMEAEYQRRKVSALEKRIKALENKLKKLTQNE